MSASELAYLMDGAENPSACVADILEEAYRHREGGEEHGAASLVFPRIIHTLGSALIKLCGDRDARPASPPNVWRASVLPDVRQRLGRAQEAAAYLKG